MKFLGFILFRLELFVVLTDEIDVYIRLINSLRWQLGLLLWPRNAKLKIAASLFKWFAVCFLINSLGFIFVFEFVSIPVELTYWGDELAFVIGRFGILYWQIELSKSQSCIIQRGILVYDGNVMTAFDTLDSWHEEFRKQVRFVSSCQLVACFSVLIVVCFSIRGFSCIIL